MVTLYSPEAQAKSERISEKTDDSLIEAVQERTRLLKSGIDTHNRAIRHGDRAFTELLKRYHAWIWKQVNSFNGLDLDEAYSAALQGFERAIAKFDLSRGYALTTFATLVVQRSIQSLFRRAQKEAEKVAAAIANAELYYEDAFIESNEQDEREGQIEALNCARENLEPTPEQIKEMRDSGMKYRAIGAFFRKSADAVRMIYNRVFGAPKKYLQPQLEQTDEGETLVAVAIEPIPERGWMGRLWSRFSGCVRFLDSSEPISNSSTISDSASEQVSGSKASPVKRLSKIWRFTDE